MVPENKPGANLERAAFKMQPAEHLHIQSGETERMNEEHHERDY